MVDTAAVVAARERLVVDRLVAPRCTATTSTA